MIDGVDNHDPFLPNVWVGGVFIEYQYINPSPSEYDFFDDFHDDVAQGTITAR